MNAAELADRLDAVRAAEDRLLGTVAKLAEAGLREPSLLPGWTRGHVLAHVALNAHSLVNLFTWARTAVETPQYPSWEERDADIETHSSRTLAEHAAALGAAGAGFRSAAREVPLERWRFEVAGIGGDPAPAETFLFGRLREVEIHHVDLDAGYRPDDWPEPFVRAVLDEVPGRMSARAAQPFVAHATDLGVNLQVGDGPPVTEVRGRGRDLLAWLLGRSEGRELESGAGALPDVPSWG